jgi:hypothetical protein
MNKTIYDLELHEFLRIDSGYVQRVPGGWIYKPFGDPRIPIFIPFDNEFQGGDFNE